MECGGLESYGGIGQSVEIFPSIEDSTAAIVEGIEILGVDCVFTRTDQEYIPEGSCPRYRCGLMTVGRQKILTIRRMTCRGVEFTLEYGG